MHILLSPIRAICSVHLIHFGMITRIHSMMSVNHEEWRKLHNEELNDLNSSPNIVRVIKSRRMRWAGHVTCMGERRSLYRVLVGKPEGKRPLGRPRHIREDNIKLDLRLILGAGGEVTEHKMCDFLHKFCSKSFSF